MPALDGLSLTLTFSWEPYSQINSHGQWHYYLPALPCKIVSSVLLAHHWNKFYGKLEQLRNSWLEQKKPASPSQLVSSSFSVLISWKQGATLRTYSLTFWATEFLLAFETMVPELMDENNIIAEKVLTPSLLDGAGGTLCTLYMGLYQLRGWRV